MNTPLSPLLAGLASIFASGTVLAADPYRGAPPPPAQYDAAVADGWYLRGDIGIGIQQSLDWDHATAKFRNETVDDTVFYGIGLGYQFNGWIRADITGEYRTKFETRAREHVPFGEPLNWEGHISAFVGLANLYADLGNYWGVTPYIGIGAGFAHVMAEGFRGDAHGLDNDQSNFAWAIHAGLSYEVNPHFKVDLGYRFTDLGEIKTGKLVCPCGAAYSGIKISHLESHDLRFGMRWMFAPEPAYAPAPAVVKY